MRTAVTVTIGRDSLRLDVAGESTDRPVEPGVELMLQLGSLLRSVPSQAGRKPSAIVLRVAPPLLQLRRLEGLPRVSGALLEELVATQAGRLFREGAGGLLTSARWDPGAPRRTLALAIAMARTTYDALLAECSARGFDRVSIQAADPAFRGMSLRPDAERGVERQLRTRRLARGALAVTAGVGSLLAMLALSMVREQDRLEAARQRLTAATADVQRQLRLVRAFEDDSLNVQRIESSRENLLRALAGVVASVPDSAYLLSLAINARGEARVTARARHASLAMAAFGAHAVSGAAPRPGGTLQFIDDDTGRWEEFTLALAGGSR